MIEKAISLLLYPWATGMRMLGVLVVDTMELVEHLRR